MNTGDRLKNRFNQLPELMEAIPGKENNEVDGIAWNHFATSTRNLILEVFGLESIHFRAFDDLFGEYMGAALINSAKGVFLAAANDFDCDLVDVNSVIAGEIFADFTPLG
jgi:hypothetical protein